MDWTQEFYAKQDAWLGIYQSEISPHNRKLALKVDRLLDGKPGRVLELGAGGGQTAAAIAELGHSVIAVDLNPSAVRHAKELAAARDDTNLSIVQGDYYTVELPAPFDVVCYFDGFGIGEDADQQRLLKRIAGWLAPGGKALVEVYTPWYWSKVAGQGMEFGATSRRYGYDITGSRMLDTWWRSDQPDETITQSLRCYSPEELGRLLEGSHLAVADIQPGGAMDYANKVYHDAVPLEDAMSYFACLEFL